MRIAPFALFLSLMPGLALADPGAPLGSSSASSLYAPSYNVIGKTASTHITTMTPRTVIEPSGPIGTDSDSLTFGRSTDDDRTLLLERRLDCFASAVAPDRDTRNRFMSRCPGNSR
jgi:hypothetical protein